MGPEQGNDERRITYFASTHTRGRQEMFGIRAIDRGKHMYVIGKTGMGKSTMLENLAIQDIQNGEGIAFIDPHGSTAEKLLDFVPHDRINDVIYFAPFDTDYPLGFNVMEDVGYDKRHLVVSGLMGALKRIWVDAWSARMEYILQNTLLALLEYPGSSLLDVNRMLTNKTFRTAVVEKITDPIVKAFWTEEFANFTDSYTREATPAIQNKIGQFTANPLIRNIIGQSKSSFDLRKAMDEKKIFIVNLSKGRMGETNASLLGSMLTVKIYLAAMSRADEPAARLARLPRFYFYVDEFQSMMNEAFADILSESRKYKLALTLANQYIEQMEEKVREAVFGNIGTLICFRVGPFDAEVLKTVFEPTFMPEDLVGLGIGQIYLTLMIDGVGSSPFSAQTIPPIEAPNISYRDDVITQSREKYGRPRSEIESTIQQKQSEFAPPPPKPKGDRRDRERDMSMGPLRSAQFERNNNSFNSGIRPGGPPSHGNQGGPASAAPWRDGPSRDRGEGTSFDAASTFAKASEDRQGRPPRYSQQYAAPAPVKQVDPEAAKRDALRAAILQASKAAPAPVKEAPAPTGEASTPAPEKSPLDLMRERSQKQAQPVRPQNELRAQPAPVRPQQPASHSVSQGAQEHRPAAPSPQPAASHGGSAQHQPRPQSQPPQHHVQHEQRPAPQPPKVVEVKPSATWHDQPAPEVVVPAPPAVERKPLPPVIPPKPKREPFVVHVEKAPPAPPPPAQNTGEVSPEVLRSVINGDNQ